MIHATVLGRVIRCPGDKRKGHEAVRKSFLYNQKLKKHKTLI
jgi:hypothetical protein